MVCDLYMKEKQMVIQQERMISQKVETANEMCKRALRAEQAQKEATEEKDTSISMKVRAKSARLDLMLSKKRDEREKIRVYKLDAEETRKK